MSGAAPPAITPQIVPQLAPQPLPQSLPVPPTDLSLPTRPEPGAATK
jgi:hypothetical protein